MISNKNIVAVSSVVATGVGAIRMNAEQKVAQKVAQNLQITKWDNSSNMHKKDKNFGLQESAIWCVLDDLLEIYDKPDATDGTYVNLIVHRGSDKATKYTEFCYHLEKCDANLGFNLQTVREAFAEVLEKQFEKYLEEDKVPKAKQLFAKIERISEYETLLTTLGNKTYWGIRFADFSQVQKRHTLKKDVTEFSKDRILEEVLEFVGRKDLIARQKKLLQEKEDLAKKLKLSSEKKLNLKKNMQSRPWSHWKHWKPYN